MAAPSGPIRQLSGKHGDSHEAEDGQLLPQLHRQPCPSSPNLSADWWKHV